ncbi:adhesin [Cupriavidus sp. EM10]|uniref:adhesin n=1 Tax=Cupriavidus sp. EM10 TaxID=2839983 RepID=UPI001CED90D6|nr:adhesin [Cupriavidus sp. EM10]
MLLSNYSMGLLVGSIALVGSVAWAYADQEENLAIGTGNYMSNIAQAANTYTFEAFTALAKSPTGSTNLTVGGKTIGVADPLHPTVQDFINFGLLPIGYSDISPLGLSFKIDLTPTNCAGDISGCSIPGLVYSTAGYRDAFGRIRTDLMGAAVVKAGQDAGVTFAETPATITGMAATWQAPNPVVGQPVGVLAMRVGSSSLLAQSMNQFYKRDGSLNLTGPMDANNQAMNRVGNFQSNGSVSAAGNVAASGNVTGNMVAGNGLQSYGNASVAGTLGAAQINTSNALVYGNQSTLGNQTVGGAITAQNIIYLASTAYAGWGCAGTAITTQPDGQVLSCQAGQWKVVGGVSQGQIVGTFSSQRPGGGFTDIGFCYTWPGGDGRENAAGGKVCPDGTLGFVGVPTILREGVKKAGESRLFFYYAATARGQPTYLFRLLAGILACTVSTTDL